MSEYKEVQPGVHTMRVSGSTSKSMHLHIFDKGKDCLPYLAINPRLLLLFTINNNIRTLGGMPLQ